MACKYETPLQYTYLKKN